MRMDSRFRSVFALCLASFATGCTDTGATTSTPIDLMVTQTCLDTHECCLSDKDCTVENPRCETGRRRCVACLPANDNCPQGQACGASNDSWACTNMCTSNKDCQKLAGGGICCSGTCH